MRQIVIPDCECAEWAMAGGHRTAGGHHPNCKRGKARRPRAMAPKSHPTYAGSFERLHGGESTTDFHRVRNDPKAVATVMARNERLRKNREVLRQKRRAGKEADYAALFGAVADTDKEESVMSGCKRNSNGTFAKGNKCGKSKRKGKRKGKRRYAEGSASYISTRKARPVGAKRRGSGRSRSKGHAKSRGRGPSDRKLKKLANRAEAALKRAAQGKGLQKTADRKVRRLKKAAALRGHSAAPKLRIGRVRKAGKGHRRHVGPMTARGSFFS